MYKVKFFVSFLWKLFLKVRSERGFRGVCGSLKKRIKLGFRIVKVKLSFVLQHEYWDLKHLKESNHFQFSSQGFYIKKAFAGSEVSDHLIMGPLRNPLNSYKSCYWSFQFNTPTQKIPTLLCART